jgi:hypothetical protein
VTLLFEDRETIRFQVQEMLAVERIRDPEKVQRELDVYNELVPGAGELSATLFIEVGDSARIREELDRLVGIDEHLVLALGDGPGSERIRARFDPRQLEADRISAVHFVRFALPPDAVRRFTDPAVRARVQLEHPAYTREAEIPVAVRASLVATLVGEPAALLHVAARAPDRARDEVEFATSRVRVVRTSGAPDRWVVEPAEPCSLIGADRELLGELALALQTAVARLAERHGAVRIEAETVAAGIPLRWRIRAVRR